MSAPSFPPGWRVHPCHPNSKKPILDAWPTLATDERRQIEAWAAEYPGCNWALACGQSGVSVIDIDGGPIGENSLADFEITEGLLPPTREHRSARGGRHLIFSDPTGTLRNSASRLGPKLDTRGGNGFIVIPPSTFEGGAYEVIEDRPIAPLPEAVVAALARKRERAQAPEGVRLDEPANVGRAVVLLRSYVERGHIAIEGRGGDELTYSLCCEVLSLGLSDEKALEIIEAEWNGHCVPPWPTDELRAKIGNAAQYAQNERGAFAAAPAHETFKVALENIMAEQRAEELQGPHPVGGYSRPQLASDLATADFPAPWYVWQSFTLGENVNLLYADGGLGKTLLLLMVAVAVAAGIPLFGRETKQMPVLLVLPEDGYGAIKLRLLAICKVLGVDLDGLQLHIWCLPGADVCLAHIQDDGTVTEGPFWAPLREFVGSFGCPIFLGVETLADIFVLDETQRAAANAAVKKVLGSFCRDFKATVWTNGHPSKSAMADGSGYAGSTGWKAAVRNLLTMERPNPNSDRRILRVAKANYGNEAELELHMLDGIFWQRAQGDAAEVDARMMGTCVAAAIAAAEQGTPIQSQRRPPRWVFNEVEKVAGRRPSRRDLLDALEDAARAGLVRYLKGNSKRMAGFYPWDEERAAELAAEAKRHADKVETLSAAAHRRRGRDE